MKTIQEQEMMIVSTLIQCNNNLMSLSEQNIFDKAIINDLKLYNYNFKTLLNTVADGEYMSLNENIQNRLTIDNNVIPFNGNPYAYLKSVENFLNECNNSILDTLNESITTDENFVNNSTQLNIDTYKDKIKFLLKELEKQNQITQYTPQVLKIKLFAKHPLFVLGYDLMQAFNIAHKQKIQLIAICYNNYHKQLMFIGKTTDVIFSYDIKTDTFDLYNNLNPDMPIKPGVKLDKDYLRTIKELTEINNIYELSADISIFDLKYTDNLYKDIQYTKYLNENALRKGYQSITGLIK